MDHLKEMPIVLDKVFRSFASSAMRREAVIEVMTDAF